MIDAQAQKLKRSTQLIKGFMLLVVFIEVLNIIQTESLDFGSIAGTTAILALLRAILVTPKLLTSPFRQWLRTREPMSSESKNYAGQVCWFSSLVSKSENIPPLKKLLTQLGAKQIKVIKMSQGQKVSRLIAWSFLTPDLQVQFISE